ncbi:hypothetical protein ANANG_G00291540 [Anguilla anguilla]|uniref:CRIB domain-containing protein n=1 Tax=Anguilla anguilla TaxID=7936 RepID=A0A9D3LL49_ANGAN|nr:hypothetical protein ANANG_G00291540 [Anguilla anguilla]
MSLGKLPGIKGLVSSSQGKRRFKNDLSVDMISPPLGDFRHTMHVGRGGDVFGDTSFLSNHGGAGSEEAESGGSKTAKFFSRTLRHVRKTPARPGRLRDLSSPPPPVSPIIKNAISLPQLNLDNGCLQRALFPMSPSCPEGSTFSSYGLQSGFVTLPRVSRLDRQVQDCSGSPEFRRNSLPDDDDDYAMMRSDSMTSFTVDLGPSLMSEVFSVIDSPNHIHTANHGWGRRRKRQSRNSRGSSGDGECGAEEEGESNEPLKMATPEEVMRSPSREELGMEPERFKRAADVLARHYSSGELRQDQTGDEDRPHAGAASNSSVRLQKRAPYAYPDEEDEIKV